MYFNGGDLHSLEGEIKTFLTATVQAFKGPIPTLEKTSPHSLTAQA